MIGVILLEDGDLALASRRIDSLPSRVIEHVVGIAHRGQFLEDVPAGGINHEQSCRFAGDVVESRPVTLAERDGALVLDLPWAEEAVVPQRLRPRPAVPPRPNR